MTLCLYTGKQCQCQPQDGIACPHIPRFSIELGGYGRDSIAHISTPDGEWVRWREVERVILDPLKQCPAAGVPGTGCGRVGQGGAPCTRWCGSTTHPTCRAHASGVGVSGHQTFSPSGIDDPDKQEK